VSSGVFLLLQTSGNSIHLKGSQGLPGAAGCGISQPDSIRSSPVSVFINSVFVKKDAFRNYRTDATGRSGTAVNAAL
jgi:hypothetical protein